jgi:hypothetical protein
MWLVLINLRGNIFKLFITLKYTNFEVKEHVFNSENP